MGASIPTPLDVAASIDRVLRRNIQWPTRNVVFADSPVTVTTFDRSIFANAVGGAMVVNLPDATLNRGMFFEIKKTDISVNTVTIQCTVGGQTIDAAGAKVLIATNDFIVVESDGANYKIVALVISAPAGGGAVFYTVNKIVKTDGIATLVPVDGTLIPFNVAVDGECSFWAAGIWTGFSPGVAAGSLNFRIDGVDYAPLSWGWNNGSGGDFTSSESLSPHISLFLTAGPHTVELVASNTVLGLNASPANPLTLSVLFPAASFSTAAPTPKAATLVVHPVPGIGDFTTIQAALAAIVALGGGYILVREGTYTPPVGGYIIPAVPVEIIGCGSGFDNPGATIIDATLFGAGDIFTSASKHKRRIADLNVVGDPTVVQRFYRNNLGTVEITDVENVLVKDVQTCFAHTEPYTVRLLKVEHRPSGGFPAQFWTFLGGAGGSSFIYADQVIVLGATIDDNPFLYATNSQFTLTQFAGPVVNAIRELRVAACEFSGEILLQTAFSLITGCKFTNGIFGVPPPRYLDFPAGFSAITGCIFLVDASIEDIRVSGGDLPVSITGCLFNNVVGGLRRLNLTVPNGANIANCDFHGCTSEQILINATSLDVTIVGCNFTDDGTAPRAIDIIAGAFRVTVSGCNFKFFSTEAIRIAGARCMVVGNTGCRVVELIATANLNRYAANDGFDPSAITGGASLIENENVTETAVDTLLDEFRRTVLVDATAAARTITLPTAASAKWRIYTIKKIDASLNTVTIDGDGAETIDGAATQLLLVQYQSITIQSDGAEWWIL